MSKSPETVINVILSANSDVVADYSGQRLGELADKLKEMAAIASTRLLDRGKASALIRDNPEHDEAIRKLQFALLLLSVHDQTDTEGTKRDVSATLQIGRGQSSVKINFNTSDEELNGAFEGAYSISWGGGVIFDLCIENGELNYAFWNSGAVEGLQQAAGTGRILSADNFTLYLTELAISLVEAHVGRTRGSINPKLVMLVARAIQDSNEGEGEAAGVEAGAVGMLGQQQQLQGGPGMYNDDEEAEGPNSKRMKR